MKKEYVSYQELSYFEGIISSYLNQDELVKDLYHRFPSLENFEQQIKEKQQATTSSTAQRAVLKNVLLKQYEHITAKDLTVKNIVSLENENTFTITTGHQLNLFTGPLYFIYKIVSTINLCKHLSKTYPKFNFVPVYWMVTEDHDFDEIRYFNYQGSKFVFEKETSGAVGTVTTQGLDKVYERICQLWPDSIYGSQLKKLFHDAYLLHKSLTDATRFLAHQLFKDDGLVILDANDAALKRLAIPYFKEELLKQTSFKEVSKTLEQWPQEFKVQVNPREINLFYLTASSRKRILATQDGFSIHDDDLQFTTAAMMEELDRHPERFSPNVIIRPLYQEVILPNLCYIGGGGEIAYWLELKKYFDTSQVVFPVLLLRNSAVVLSHKQHAKLLKTACTVHDLFLPSHELATTITNNVTSIPIDFTPQRVQLQEQFKHLYDIAAQTDKSFLGAVAAQEKKQLNGLDSLEKRLLKAQKHAYKSQIDSALNLQSSLFPRGGLQERYENFAAFYLEHGMDFLEIVKTALDPLHPAFTVITLPNN